jgi:hypothetical protein
MEASGPLSVPIKEPEREAGTAAGATLYISRYGAVLIFTLLNAEPK